MHDCAAASHPSELAPARAFHARSPATCRRVGRHPPDELDVRTACAARAAAHDRRPAPQRQLTRPRGGDKCLQHGQTTRLQPSIDAEGEPRAPSVRKPGCRRLTEHERYGETNRERSPTLVSHPCLSASALLTHDARPQLRWTGLLGRSYARECGPATPRASPPELQIALWMPWMPWMPAVIRLAAVAQRGPGARAP
jgi:hypothetical protein